MSNLTILNTSIRSLNNLYSLNDLHRVSGGEMKHQPSNFIRLDTTQGLIEEIEKDRSSDLMIAHKTVRGGRNPELQGTWVCEELALAYATWISPKFHLVVLRAFKVDTSTDNIDYHKLLNYHGREGRIDNLLEFEVQIQIHKECMQRLKRKE